MLFRSLQGAWSDAYDRTKKVRQEQTPALGRTQPLRSENGLGRGRMSALFCQSFGRLGMNVTEEFGSKLEARCLVLNGFGIGDK